MCEVAAGAGGCVAVDVQRLAAVGGPAALQAVRLVLPEGALGHVSLRVDWLWGEKKIKIKNTLKDTVFRSSLKLCNALGCIMKRFKTQMVQNSV